MNTLPPHSTHFKHLSALGSAGQYAEQIQGVVERIRLFEDFEAEEIAIMARYMVCYQAPAATEIIREGEPGDFMLLIIDGSVEITKLNSVGFPLRVGMAGPGKTLGEMSLIDGEPRFASCCALADTLFAVLDRDSLSQIIAEEPRVGIKILMELLQLLNQRLRNVSTELVKLAGSKQLF